MIYFGATADLGFIWLLADTLNAMMAIPNLIALALLSPDRLQADQRVLCQQRTVGRSGQLRSRITTIDGGLPGGPPPLHNEFSI